MEPQMDKYKLQDNIHIEQWRDSDTCTLSAEVVKEISLMIYKAISKFKHKDIQHNIEDVHSYTWERIIKRLPNYDRTRGTCTQWLRNIIGTSILEYLKQHIKRNYSRKEGEIIYSHLKGMLDNGDMMRIEEVKGGEWIKIEFDENDGEE